MGGILTITMNPSIDTSCSVSRVIAEQKLRCSFPRHEPGGGGINVSRAIKKLGGESLFMIKPDRRELCMFVGYDAGTDGDIEALTKSIVNKGRCENIVISLGAAGALLVRNDRSLSVHAPKVRIVSRVGAGYGMVAGIILCLSRGRGIEEAVKYGVAAGSSAVTTPGSELSRRRDTEGLVPENTSRMMTLIFVHRHTGERDEDSHFRSRTLGAGFLLEA